MTNYSRRRRGYYGPVEPTPPSKFGSQVIIVIAGLIVLGCVMTLVQQFWTEPAFTDFKIRSRLY